MSVYTASVVGGGRGGKLSIRALTASDRFELRAVADISPQAREAIEKEWPGVQTFATHTEMFAECPADVICVATYASSHRQIALEAAKLPAVKGMLVEKPLGETTAAGREIVDALRAKGIPLAVPHGLLVADHSAEILRRVREGQIGELKLVEMQSPRWDIINAGIHWINFFVALIGTDAPQSVL